MPNRILRDWTDSLAIDALSAEAERFFVRLIQKADDFGRYHADTRLLASTLFPLKTDLCPSTVSQWLAECQASGILTSYPCPKGRKYLQINNFNQRTRLKQSKFPAPASAPPASDSQTPDKRPLEAETETLFGDGGGERGEAREPAAPQTPPPSPSSPSSSSSSSIPTAASQAHVEAIPKPLDHHAFCQAWADWLNAIGQRHRAYPDALSRRVHLATLGALPLPHAIATVQLSAANAWKNFFPDKISQAQINAIATTLKAGATQTPATLPEPPGWQEIWSHHYDLPEPAAWADLPPYVQENLTQALRETVST